MWTNREFYDFVDAMPPRLRPLEDYLRALAALIAPHRCEPHLRFARKHWDYAAVKGGESRWYNASVDGFLERGAEGAWHGWGAEGEDLEYMPFLTWKELCSFLRSGQWYE